MALFRKPLLGDVRRPGAAIATCIAGLLITTHPSLGQPAPTDAVVAVVNGTEIKESDVRIADEDFGRTLPPIDGPVRRERLITFLTDSILVAKYATQQKVGDPADIARRVTYTRNKALMSQMLQSAAEQAVGEDALRKAYDDLVAKTPREQEVRLRVMFFKFDVGDEAQVKAAEARAQGALERVRKGEDFAAVAGEVSDDPSASTNGGDFGFRTRMEMGKEYAEHAFAMKNGDVSPIIKTRFGWHIVKREDDRFRQPAPFEYVKERLQVSVARKAQMDLIAKLRAEAKIERRDQAQSTDTAPGTAKEAGR